MPKFITIKDDKIVAIRHADEIVPGEMIDFSDSELGDVLVDGKFTKPTHTPKPKPDTATELSAIRALLESISAKLDTLK